MNVSRAAYSLAGAAAVALWLPWGAAQHLRGRTQFDARLGRRRARRGADAPLWIHAASVGEVNAAAPVVREWLSRAPGTPLLWTTQTMTGRSRAEQQFPEAMVMLAPFDACGAPARLLHAASPLAVLVAETEIWPGWLHAARRAAVPVAFINARMSARSASRYARAASLLAPEWAQVRLVAAQSAADGARFIAAGARPESVVITGNTKWDQAAGDDVLRSSALTAWLRDTRRAVLVAGSTRPGEEHPIAAAARALRAGQAAPLLVVAPRHLERVAECEDAVRAGWPGVRVLRWSAARGAPPSAAFDVLLLDTHGELAAGYAAATAAFVGGTLVPLGGHNVGEPALAGVPVAFGPSTANCADIADALLADEGAVRVHDAATLADAWQRWLDDPAARARSSADAVAAVRVARGAAVRTVDALQRCGIPMAPHA